MPVTSVCMQNVEQVQPKLSEANVQNVKYGMKAIWHTQGIALIKFIMIVFIIWSMYHMYHTQTLYIITPPEDLLCTVVC